MLGFPEDYAKTVLSISLSFLSSFSGIALVSTILSYFYGSVITGAAVSNVFFVYCFVSSFF